MSITLDGTKCRSHIIEFDKVYRQRVAASSTALAIKIMTEREEIPFAGVLRCLSEFITSGGGVREGFEIRRNFTLFIDVCLPHLMRSEKDISGCWNLVFRNDYFSSLSALEFRDKVLRNMAWRHLRQTRFIITKKLFHLSKTFQILLRGREM